MYWSGEGLGREGKFPSFFFSRFSPSSSQLHLFAQSAMQATQKMPTVHFQLGSMDKWSLKHTYRIYSNKRPISN